MDRNAKLRTTSGTTNIHQQGSPLSYLFIYFLSIFLKQTLVKQRFSQPVREYEEKLLDIGTKVRYPYEPGELEGHQYKGERRK